MDVAVIGGGSWGTALAIALSAKENYSVALWIRSSATYRSIVLKRCNEIYLPEIRIPSSVKPIMDPAEAVEGKRLVILAVPSVFMRTTIRDIRGQLDSAADIVCAAKSLEPETHLRLSEVLKDELPTNLKGRISIITGPGHAEELARFIPTVLSISSDNAQTAQSAREHLMTENFKLEYEPDLIGAELGGAVSNVAALASGIIEGSALGDSLRGNVLAALYRETISLGQAMGAKMATFAGRSGLGNFFSNCSSPYSRHRTLGKKLGEGRALSEIRSQNNMVYEGISTLRSIFVLSHQGGLKSPLINIFFRIMFEGESPLKIADLFDP